MYNIIKTLLMVFNRWFKYARQAIWKYNQLSELKVLNKLCNFLDNKDDCQCLLSDLMEMLLHFRTVSDKLYSEKRLRKLLSERYGNTVLEIEVFLHRHFR
ncbi:hypothetical protein AVEN_108809-1 [Araneus ventricosus]|uniref:Uncharacterized protein n=1 Tax=Araneus ventricosus TaxID=182803 RepID=A0A4Y2CCV6_ARAVE|nr:hypothetical protein AVEN_108809-1 [Araneus ventricosus]